MPSTLRELMQTDPEVDRIIRDPTIPHKHAADRIFTLTGVRRTYEAVRLLRKQLGIQRRNAPKEPEPEACASPEVGPGRVTVDANGGEFVNVTLEEPVMGNDFDHVFRLFKLDPDLYQIVDDTVRMSTWQQSRRTSDGDRDLVQLYSYSCRFRRRVAGDLVDLEEFAERQSHVRNWRPDLTLRRTPGSGLGEASTFVINWADWQLGKGEGGGVKATEQRVLDSFDRCTKRLLDLRKLGRNVEGVAIVNMGDPVEGCMGQYAAQLATVELTQRQQLLLAMDLFTTGILHFSSLAEKVDVVGVICNHGEWNRVDYKNAADDSDNAGAFLMDTVQRIISARSDMGHVQWTIPHDEMVVMAELSGVQNAFTHGHKIPSGTLKSEEAWLAQQSIHLLRRYGKEPQIWTTAHKHHAFLIDLGPWHRIQCSALDGGSKWYLDSSGKWSMPGTTTYLAGTHDVRCFSDYSIE